MMTYARPDDWPISRPQTLSPGRIDIWRLDLDGGFDEALLDGEEIARAARFTFDRDRRRWSACRAFLRCLLGEYLGEDPSGLQFAAGEWGKPILHDVDRGIAFNVSHSGNIGLVAIGAVSDLGVDIEEVRAMHDRNGVAEQNFARAEYDALLAQPAERQDDAFFACWTQKEAIVKLWGEGLSADLSSFAVRVDPSARAQVLEVSRPDLEAADIALFDFKPHTNYWAALAAPAGEVHQLRFLRPA